VVGGKGGRDRRGEGGKKEEKTKTKEEKASQRPLSYDFSKI